MKELPRLLDEPQSDLERALLQAGMSYRSSRATWSKTLGALGLTGSVTAVTSTAVAGKLSPFAKFSGAKLLVAISVVGAVSAVPIGYGILHGRGSSSVASKPRVSESAERLPTGSPDEPLVTPKAVGQRATVPASVASTRPSKSNGRGGPSPVRLGQELAALDAVRSTLAQGNAQGAIFLLDGYAQTCPHGRLELEADLLRMDALAKSGQSEAAKRLASEFLKRHPTSVLTARARTYLGE
jgi:hypothetical protein